MENQRFSLAAEREINIQLYATVHVSETTVYADATIVRHLGDLNGLPSINGGLPRSTEISRLEGKEWGYGWNAGILYEIDKNNRFGLTYRSKVDIDFSGDYSNQLPTRVGGLNGATVPGKLTLNLPEMWEISAYHRVAPQWAVHYSMAYTRCFQFTELKTTGSNGNTLFEKEEEFRDAYRIALGTTYYHDDNWTFRAGVAFDNSPVPAGKRTISIPDQDHFWLNAGTTYAFNKDMSVDVGVSYMDGNNVDISAHAPGAFSSVAYDFSSKDHAWLYGVNLNYTF